MLSSSLVSVVFVRCAVHETILCQKVCLNFGYFVNVLKMNLITLFLKFSSSVNPSILKGFVFRNGRVLDLILFDFAIEGRESDLQQACRFGFVASGVLQYAHNVATLHCRQFETIQRGAVRLI